MALSIILLAASLAAPQASSPQEPPPTAPAASPAASPAAAIEAGLKAFRQHRYQEAEIQFRKAVDADAQSAAAHFYLGYTYYKVAEPTLRLTPDKEKAKEEFAKAFELDPQFKPDWGPKKK